ncbi:glycosyltransferase [Paeniclostridium sordellii]|uniref:glycosyltransferase n=1 Tax=Paraclostridium sordellii TaxID=1505 RepID=UPI0012EDE611|nr:glycosyltransferase [Paeniclostridium sordellii]MDU2686948.1 glycosyltransferase [Paeniclostridium sordellii]MDU6247550.1 glycosyltransferase [Paeniclostridium sordellii]MVO72887.1 glycosyltransferase [Paeniclostridium sordellii]
MKKVLFLIHTLGGGGAEKVLVNVANNMDKSEFDVTVMTVINTGIFREALDSNVNYKYIFNIPFIGDKSKSKKKAKSGSLLGKASKINSLLGKLYSFFWRHIPANLFYKLAIKDKYDVEIAFLEGICAKIISGSNNPTSKKISWIHVDLINQNKSKFIFKNEIEEKNCYEKFNQIVCVSKVVKDQFIKKFNIKESKVIVKYNPIDSIEIIEKSKEDVLDIKRTDKFLFCSVGRLNTQKGYDRLLRVHKKLIEEGLDYNLWIIGEGNKRKELDDFIKQNNLQDSVKLLGFKENPYKYIKMSDAFVCSSRAEGFSTVASESTILEKPIVTVDCSGMKELLGENNEYGIVTENNEESLLEGMKKILLDKELYNYYLCKVKTRADIFNIENAIENIEQICEK